MIEVVANWRRCWTWISMQSLAGIATINAVYGSLPADVAADVPAKYIHWATVVLSGFAMFGRLVQQQPKEEPTP